MIVGSGTTVMVRLLVAVAALLSVTRTVNVELPVAVGVPLMRPEVPVRLSPEGNRPVVMDHVYGPVPPAAARVWLYATLISPLGRVAVVIDRG